MEKLVTKPPVIANVNWFRTDDEGHFLWPGFGDNLRVIEWVLRRAFGEVDARETTLGYEPYPEDIDLEGSGVTKETLADLLSVDPELWKAECKGIHEFYAKFGDKTRSVSPTSSPLSKRGSDKKYTKPGHDRITACHAPVSL